MKFIIGIDPGFNGGIAVLDSKTRFVEAERAPIILGKGKRVFDTQKMVEIIMKYSPENTFAAIEKVGPHPKEGVTSSFNFGKGYGLWLGILSAARIPYIEVAPQQWKKTVLPYTDKSKIASINACKNLFPDVDLKPGKLRKDHDGIAEAILIAIYGGIRFFG